ncbi:MAG: hypothetical protein ACI4SF_08150 [Oscillospiraceae bacterium]
MSTAAYGKILTFVRTLNNELDWEDCLVLSGWFEQHGIDKKKQAQQNVLHNNTTPKPPITMTKYST